MTTPAPARAAQQTVFLLAHADDEFAVFAEIEAALAAGSRVVFAYLTDGGYGGQSVERRAAESCAVLRDLGVSDKAIHFFGNDLGIADQSLHRRLDDALAASRQLLDPNASLTLFVPAWEGGHHDHDASHLIGLVLAREHRAPVEMFQFAMYHGRRLPAALFRIFSPLPENGAVVERAMSWRDRWRYLRYCCFWYPSQRKTFLALSPLILMNYVFVGRQRLQRVDPARVQQRPHDGPMLYERRAFCTWDEFARLTADLRAAASAPPPARPDT